jgi:antitoxin (DNA-binding transcriptional repressor) of toxin-antitoxin stability system
VKTVNIHEAKTHLSRLIEAAMKGESFIIAKAGKPMVKVEAIVKKPIQRIGFMKGQFEVPDDFDTMFAEEIRSMFEDGPLFPDEVEQTKR